jgi:CRP/FNR family transcriptional regulator
MHAAYLKPVEPSESAIRLRLPERRTGPEPVQRRIRPGQPLFHEGDHADYVYRIVSGVVRLTRLQQDGRRQVISFGFPGDLVGLPDDDRHTTECEAITTCDILAHRCPRPTGPDRNPDVQRFLMDAALQEIRALQDHFLLLGRRLALEKTAAFLLLLLDRLSEPLGKCQAIRLPMNRTDIADYLGLTPETVSRSFTELRGRRALALDDANTVIVLDPAQLRAIAEGGVEA